MAGVVAMLLLQLSFGSASDSQRALSLRFSTLEVTQDATTIGLLFIYGVSRCEVC